MFKRGLVTCAFMCMHLCKKRKKKLQLYYGIKYTIPISHLTNLNAKLNQTAEKAN